MVKLFFLKNIPNLNQSLFKGVKILEFNKPKIKKIKEIIRDHNLYLLTILMDIIAIIKKTIKKTIPKLRLELILISSI